MKERVWRWSGCDLLFAWVLYKYFIEGERWSNKEVERERERERENDMRIVFGA
jgi:hypothetical protein